MFSLFARHVTERIPFVVLFSGSIVLFLTANFGVVDCVDFYFYFIH
jgi:hypothetical protein